MKYQLVSYYTINTGYADEAAKLGASAYDLKLPIYIRPIDNLGSWQKNTHYKPIFLKECLDKFKMPIVYVDSDAIIRQCPVLFDVIDADIAVHYRENRELLSGTMYLNYNENVLRLLNAWIAACEKYPDKWEQRILEQLLNLTGEWLGILNIYHLPASYCQIFDIMKNEGEPVIEHFQASRRYKKLVETGK
jgi:hypothetical protein